MKKFSKKPKPGELTVTDVQEIKALQIENGGKVDGIVGTQTWWMVQKRIRELEDTIYNLSGDKDPTFASKVVLTSAVTLVILLALVGFFFNMG